VPAEITLCTQTCSWTVGGIPGDRVSAMSLQARPNPTLGSTTVSFVAPEPGEARIEVFSTSGRLVRTLLAGPVPAGIGAVSWNGRDDRGEPLSSGVYLVRLSLAGNTITRKVSLLSN
jgi:flagellar hook assembly protein FlgD